MDASNRDPQQFAPSHREIERRRHRYAFAITLIGMFVLIAVGSFWIYTNLLAPRP